MFSHQKVAIEKRKQKTAVALKIDENGQPPPEYCNRTYSIFTFNVQNSPQQSKKFKILPVSR
jgi:hypothetical protein